MDTEKMLAELSEKVRVLEAKEAIRDKLAAYCRSVDRIDPELGYTVFAEDCVADYGDFFQGTGRGFIDWCCNTHKRMRYTIHRISNMTIVVNGNRAGSECYVHSAVESIGDDEDIVTDSRCRYLDEWECRNGDWVIVKRRLANDIAYLFSIDEPERFGTARNKSDASYDVLGI